MQHRMLLSCALKAWSGNTCSHMWDLLDDYLCSLRLWRCCLMRASILAATSSHSLARVSSWGVVRPLSSCGVSEQEKDLSRLLCARQTAAYCTMFSSGVARAREVTKQQLCLSTNVVWGPQKIATILGELYNPKAGFGNVTALILTWGQAVGELARAHLIVELVLGWTEVTQIFGYLGSLCDEGVLLLAGPALYHKLTPLQTEKDECDVTTNQQRSDLDFTQQKEINEKAIPPLTLEEIVAVSLQ